jgi:DeoR family suf operon transcriptional repressor
MQATRQDILDYLRRHGRGSVKELGQLLGLTSTGIRQHLTILERDGLIEGHEERGRVGRPALVYGLTPCGDALYPKKYDSLASTLIEEMKTTIGSRGFQSLLRRVAVRFADGYQDMVEGKDLPERVEEVARIIEGEGCLVDTEREDGTYFIHRYTCPFPNVATTHTSLCSLHGEFIRRLLQADVRLISCIIRGDRCCTYRISAVSAHKSLQA